MRRRATAVAFIALYLIAVDIVIGVVFPYPSDPRQSPTSLQQYFEFGRSVEGKLRRMTAATDALSAPIVGTGWIDGQRSEELPTRVPEGHLLVAVYGMSHTGRLATAMAQEDSRLVPRIVTAPGGTPSWAFAAFEADLPRRAADVAILGVMTDGVARLSTTSGSTMNFDNPYPYTNPRYGLEDGRLVSRRPPFTDVVDYRAYLSEPARWEEYLSWLEQNDPYFDSFLYRKSALDESALFRLARRAYAWTTIKRRDERVYTEAGFNADSEEVRILKRLVTEFSERARRSGSLPIVYIINNQGRSDHLYRVLRPVIEERQIRHLSTHVIAPPDDPRVFLDRNSHFVASKDRELAREMIKIIDRYVQEDGR